ncbi:hypothetical protein IFM89_010022 [Coptis chinensis]|uniref:Uncharacterized protein n=1 Tax=Coptis chinensis TaxID=261450 RepID=A0A835LV31_9MAGN|nr:hypothetical protein IFM89_010022 [Coptis chinensis]
MIGQSSKTGNWADGNQTHLPESFFHTNGRGAQKILQLLSTLGRPDHIRKVRGWDSLLQITRIPSGECFAGVSTPLSLFHQINHGDLEATSNLVVNNLVNGEGISMAQSDNSRSLR